MDEVKKTNGLMTNEEYEKFIQSVVGDFSSLFTGSKYYYSTNLNKAELDPKTGKQKGRTTFFMGNAPWKGKKPGKRTLEYPGHEVTGEAYKTHFDERRKNIALTLPPIMQKDNRTDNYVKFGAIDVDIYQDPKEIERIVGQIYQDKIPLVPCYSKSKGLHLYLFSRDTCDADQMIGALEHFRELLKIKAKEIFPKQKELKKDANGLLEVGNAITLPYRDAIIINRKTRLIDKKGNILGVEFQMVPGESYDEASVKEITFNKECPSWIKNKNMETGLFLEFLDYAKQQQQTGVLFSDFPKLDLKDLKEENKAQEEDQSGAIPLSEPLQKILDNIKNKKEHKREGTFDNWVTDFVFQAMEDSRSDQEILDHLYSVWKHADKVEDLYQGQSKDDYFKAKITKARLKFNKADPGPLREKFIKNIVYLKDIEKYWDNTTRRYYGERALDTTYNHIFPRGMMAPTWFKKHVLKKIVEGLAYRPEFYKKDNPVFKNPDDHLLYCNKYKPSDLVPRRPQSRSEIEPWEELLEYLFPNEEHRNHVLDWLAYIVQHPGQKLRYAILVMSTDWQVGKGSLHRAMEMILGKENTMPGNVKSMTDKGSMFADQQLVLIDECKSSGDISEKRNLVNDLKTIITEHRIQARRMRVDYKLIETSTNYLIFTNNKDALSIGKGDARYYVLFHEEERLDNAFYKSYHDWLEGPDKKAKNGKDGGAELIYYLLKTRDLSKFYPKAPAPDTEFKDEMAEESAHPLTQKLREWLDEGIEPFALGSDVIGSNELGRYIEKHCKGKLVAYGTNTKTLKKSLQEIGATELGQVLHKARNEKPTLWVTRNHAKYEKESPTKMCNEIWNPLALKDSPEDKIEEKVTKHFMDNQVAYGQKYEEAMLKKNKKPNSLKDKEDYIKERRQSTTPTIMDKEDFKEMNRE